MTWNYIIQEGLGIFFGIFSALIIWWIKEWFDRKKEKTALFVGISGEISAAQNKILDTLINVVEAIKNENVSFDYKFNFEPKVYNEVIKKIGLIGDKWIVKNVIRAYSLIEGIQFPISLKDDKYKLPIYAHRLNLIYNALDSLNELLEDEYNIKADSYNLIDTLSELSKHLDIDNEIRNLMFEKYPDLAIELYKSTE